MKKTVQVPEFVRWSSVFQHVFVYRQEKGATSSYLSWCTPCSFKLLCTKTLFSLSATNNKAGFGWAVKMFSCKKSTLGDTGLKLPL